MRAKKEEKGEKPLILLMQSWRRREKRGGRGSLKEKGFIAAEKPPVKQPKFL